MRSGNLALLAFLLIISLTAPLAARAQVESNLPGAGFDTPSTPDSPPPPTIEVYSRETIVDVLVTDAQGQPVRGLTRSDFTIEEGDRPQPIRGFYEYSKDAPPAPTRTLPPDTYTNSTALPASGPVQIFYYILPPPSGTDAAICQGALIIRAKQYIADYLRSMPAGTQVAIFSYAADRGLQLVQSFTTDGPLAAAAVDNMVVQRVGNPPSADPLAAADQIAAYVAGIHGRKNLIWIGSPLMITRDGGYSWGNPDMTLVHRLMDTYDRFTREQIAIYPFDPMGVPAPGGFGCPQPPALGRNSLRAEEVAEGTGGSAIYNNNDFKSAVARIVDDTSHYYTLSYIPPRAHDDGHFYPIKIQVSRPGLHLVYRNGYNDEHPAPPDAVLKVHMTQASMGLGSLPATQLIFDMQVRPSLHFSNAAGRHALPSAKPGTAYDLLFKLDPTQLAFSQTPDLKRTGSLEFDVAAYDSYGKLLTVRSQTLKISLTPEQYGEFVQTPFQFFLPIDLPGGQLFLRSGVFDTVSGKVGTLEIPLTIGKK